MKIPHYLGNTISKYTLTTTKEQVQLHSILCTCRAKNPIQYSREISCMSNSLITRENKEVINSNKEIIDKQALQLRQLARKTSSEGQVSSAGKKNTFSRRK